MGITAASRRIEGREKVEREDRDPGSITISLYGRIDAKNLCKDRERDR